jgi:hypothetical protein
MKADADEAVRLAPTLPDGYAKLGNVLLQEARQETARRSQAARLGLAVKNYGEAIRLYGDLDDADKDKDLASTRLLRSQAYLEWAHSLDDKPAQKAYLEEALKDAEAAVRLKYTHLDYAYVARGNALEELALLAGEKGRYAEAAAAFTEAIALGTGHAKYWIDRGRCLYKQATYGGEGAYLANARQDLEAALAKKPKPYEEMEACYWLGALCAGQTPPEFARAEEYYGRSMKAASQQTGGYGWERIILSNWAGLALARYKSDPKAEAATDYLEQARERASSLAARARTRDDAAFGVAAGRLLVDVGKAHEARNEPLQALAVYKKALADLAWAKAAEVPLLSARNRLLVAPGWQALLKEQGEKPEPGALLEGADRAVRQAQDPALTAADQAEAAGAAGLCYQDTANHPDTPDAKRQPYRERSIVLLEQAVRIGPKSPGLWYWHTAIGEQCVRLMKQTADAERKQGYSAKARAHLNEALQFAGDNEIIRQVIQDVQKQLDE